MRLISHRGNTDGINPALENHPDYIDEAMKEYEVEIDIRLIGGKLMLGHDLGQYAITKGWLEDRADKLLVHCKDYESLSELSDTKLKAFYHSSEPFVAIRNDNAIWCHDLSRSDTNSIVPLLGRDDILLFKYIKAQGVCSDYIGGL